ncbi:MAG: T9SS type A sorting domain-containing protein [Bacteroidetes bacterium]|nr:T9SS type A sorting domain-containing protein [Bacteroidota bacterium]
MKHIQLILLCLIFNFAKGQTPTEWFPIGAEYYYDYINYSQIDEPNDTGFFKLSVERDTIINDKNCRIIEGNYTNGRGSSEKFDYNFFVYENNNAIFRYIDNEFFKIYDFNAQVGDSISYPGLFQDSSCDTIKYFIDSIKLDSKYGNLKVQYFHYKELCKQSFGLNYNIEYMGDRLFLFTNDFIAADATEPTFLRCYKDASNNLNFTERDCAFISTSILNQKKVDKIKLFPNPASDYLVIDNQSNESIQVKILNNIGQTNSIIKLEKGNNRIDLNELNNGIYFILSDNYLLKTFVKF